MRTRLDPNFPNIFVGHTVAHNFSQFVGPQIYTAATHAFIKASFLAPANSTPISHLSYLTYPLLSSLPDISVNFVDVSLIVDFLALSPTPLQSSLENPTSTSSSHPPIPPTANNPLINLSSSKSKACAARPRVWRPSPYTLRACSWIPDTHPSLPNTQHSYTCTHTRRGYTGTRIHTAPNPSYV